MPRYVCWVGLIRTECLRRHRRIRRQARAGNPLRERGRRCPVRLGGPIPGESATGGVVARAQELHRVGNDIGCLAFCAVLRLPLAPLQAPVDRDRASLGQVARGILALRAPYGDVEVVGLVGPFAARAVLATRVARDPQTAHGRAARQRAQLGVGGQVSGHYDSIDVGGGHGLSFSLCLFVSHGLSVCVARGQPEMMDEPAFVDRAIGECTLAPGRLFAGPT